MIDPEFWSDEAIGKWSAQAKLFYIGLWNFADDEGRFKAHPELLRSQIFPYDHQIDIDQLKAELGSKILWYSANNSQYGFIRNFLKHQRIDRPMASKLPSPRRSIDELSSKAQEHVLPNISKYKIREVKLIEGSQDPKESRKEQQHQRLINRFLELKGTSRSKLTSTQLTGTYKRHGRSAVALIDEAGGLDHALVALECAAAYFERKRLTWTLDTVARHLPDLSSYHRELQADQHGLTANQLDQFSQLASWLKSKTQPSGDGTGTRLTDARISDAAA